MKRLLLSFLVLIVFAQCSYKVTRTGYQQAQNSGSDTQREVYFKYELDETLDGKEPLGKIRLMDAGATVNCSEADALKLLEGEAWGAGANVVLIQNVRRPSFSSSCYRCTAYFYYVEDESPFRKEPPLEQDIALEERMAADERNKAVWTVFGFAVGIALGFLLVQ